MNTGPTRPWLRLLALLVLLLVGCAGMPTATVDNPPEAETLAPLSRDQGPVVAFALGGGAARGFAHVGVLKVLDQHGIRADLVTGTSAGSVAGALFAAGLRGDELEEEALRLERGNITDYIFPDRGIIRGERLQRYVNEAVDNRPLEALPTRFVAVATDLRSGELVAFNNGNTGMAVRASSSVPGLVQPVTIRGRDYVDGGLVSQVPIRIARDMGADIVIAVDVSRLPEDTPPIESTLDVLRQAIMIMSVTQVDQELPAADVVIRPSVREIDLGEFEARSKAMAAGERAAEAMLPQIRAAIAGATPGS
ncbi:MAG: patatin-like phospholipase family protein [Gammaproteobacteria bacterium]|nr:patatin-like phospholipase family protein [Gammaproteobacteria bacterium]